MPTIEELQKEIDRLNEIQNINNSNQEAMQGVLDLSAVELGKIRDLAVKALAAIREA